MGILAYVGQVVQEVGKALESEVCAGGEGLSGLDPEVVVILLDAVSPVRGGAYVGVCWVGGGGLSGGASSSAKSYSMCAP